MKIHLQNELEKLKIMILDLSKLVQESARKSVLAIKNLDEKLANEVIDDDHKIDLKEVEVEEECLKILALHQPVAVDLRFVIAILKINNDLERVGDLATNLCQRVKYIIKSNKVEIPFEFDRMSKCVFQMIQKSLDAFMKMDTKLAREVHADDHEVDEIHKNTFSKVYQEIKKNPENVETLINYLTISRFLERMSDYSTNIAEDVIYLVEGKIVRHSDKN